MQASTVQGSVMGASRMDHSFVVLSKQSRIPGPGMPLRPTRPTPQSDIPQSSKAMEESYVVLPPPISSVYKPELGPEGGVTQLPVNTGSNSPLQGNTNNTNIFGFHSSVTVLKRAFEIATSQTQVWSKACSLSGTCCHWLIWYLFPQYF
jgi:beclin